MEWRLRFDIGQNDTLAWELKGRVSCGNSEYYLDCSLTYGIFVSFFLRIVP